MMAPNLPQIRVADIDILTDWDFENVKAFGDSIPGYRSSATFLTTLRSNLHLSTCPTDSPYSSLVSTPTSTAFSSTALLAHPIPSPLSISTTTTTTTTTQLPSPLPHPTITTSLATPSHPSDRAAALRLIADSVAQQRQSAAKALVLHPYSVAGTVLLSGILARYCSLQVLFAIATSLVVVALAALYWVTRDYAVLAAGIDGAWLEGAALKGVSEQGGCAVGGNGNGVKRHSKCEDPIVLVSKWGEEVVGALVLRVVKRERKGYVRAWTVDSSQRGRGVGGGLLEEGVRVAWGKGARCMQFETGHANSHHVLPPMFNGGFEEQEVRAQALLTDLVAECRREKSSR